MEIKRGTICEAISRYRPYCNILQSAIFEWVRELLWEFSKRNGVLITGPAGIYADSYFYERN